MLHLALLFILASPPDEPASDSVDEQEAPAPAPPPKRIEHPLTTRTLIGLEAEFKRKTTAKAESMRVGSLEHAFGAPLVLTGLSEAIVCASVGGIIASEQGPHLDTAPLWIGMAIGLIQLVVGAVLISAGNSHFE